MRDQLCPCLFPACTPPFNTLHCLQCNHFIKPRTEARVLWGTPWWSRCQPQVLAFCPRLGSLVLEKGCGYCALLLHLLMPGSQSLGSCRLRSLPAVTSSWVEAVYIHGKRFVPSELDWTCFYWISGWCLFHLHMLCVYRRFRFYWNVMGHRGFLSNFDITSVSIYKVFSIGEFEKEPSNQHQCSPWCLLWESLSPGGLIMHILSLFQLRKRTPNHRSDSLQIANSGLFFQLTVSFIFFIMFCIEVITYFWWKRKKSTLNSSYFV